MEFSARSCELSEVIDVYRDVFITEKGWSAEDLINRPDGRNFILLADGELAGGMKIILKMEAQTSLMFEQEFYQIPDRAGEIAIVAIRKKYRGTSSLKYLFRELHRLMRTSEISEYYAIVDSKVNRVFSLFGFIMSEDAKTIWGDECFSGCIKIHEAMETIQKNHLVLYEFLKS